MANRFTGAFFEARISTAPIEDDPVDRWIAWCWDIIENNKFSQRPDQNEFERSVVDSCLDRLERGRLLSPAQSDLIIKMHGRRGPVSFCGHRN